MRFPGMKRRPPEPADRPTTPGGFIRAQDGPVDALGRPFTGDRRERLAQGREATQERTRRVLQAQVDEARQLNGLVRRLDDAGNDVYIPPVGWDGVK